MEEAAKETRKTGGERNTEERERVELIRRGKEESRRRRREIVRIVRMRRRVTVRRVRVRRRVTVNRWRRERERHSGKRNHSLEN